MRSAPCSPSGAVRRTSRRARTPRTPSADPQELQMTVIRTLRRHPVLTYFVLVYALSWACWIPAAIARTWLSFPYLVFAVAGAGMPSLLGILLTALLSGKTGLAELSGRLGRVRAPLRWYAV